MEAGPAEPDPWHAQRRACLLIWLCSPQVRERGEGGFAVEGRCCLPQAGDRSGRLCPPLGIECALTQKQRWGPPKGEESSVLASCLSALTASCGPFLGFLPSPVSPPLSFSPISWGPTLANTHSRLSCSTGRQVPVPRLGQLAKVSLPGLSPRWPPALGAGSPSRAVGGWSL